MGENDTNKFTCSNWVNQINTRSYRGLRRDMKIAEKWLGSNMAMRVSRDEYTVRCVSDKQCWYIE